MNGKSILKIMAGIVLTPIVALCLLMLLLYLPPVQQWAVNLATDYAREETGWNVKIERVRLRPLLDIDLQGVSVHNKDLDVQAESVVLDLDCSRLLELELGVESIDFEDANVDTKTLIAQLRIRGSLSSFHFESDNIQSRQQHAELTKAILKGANLDLQMRDTTVVDTTTSEPLRWILAIGDIAVENSKVTCHIPDDSVRVWANIHLARIQGGLLDLGNASYGLDSIALKLDSVSYNQITLKDLSLHASHFRYSGDTLSLPDLKLATPHSTAHTKILFPFSALDSIPSTAIQAEMTGQIGMEDIQDMMPRISKYTPSGPVSLHVHASGNLQQMHVDTLSVLAEPWVSLDASGTLTHLIDDKLFGADINFNTRTYDMRQVTRITGLEKNLRIPRLTARGKVSKQGNLYSLNAKIQEARGRVDVKADYNDRTEAYNLQTKIHDLNLHHFLPKDSLFLLTGEAKIHGRGLDFQSPHTTMQGYVQVDSLGYKHLNMGNLAANIKKQRGYADIDVLFNNNILRAQACVEAKLSKKLNVAHFSLTLTHADLHRLGLMDSPFALSMVARLDGSSDLRKRHKVKGSIHAIELSLQDTVYHPQDIELDFQLQPDTTRAWAHAGDLFLDFNSPLSWEKLLASGERLAKEVQMQFKARQLDQPLLKRLLPMASLSLRSGGDNPFHNILKAYTGVSFQSMNLSLACDSTTGVNALGGINRLNTGAVLLDTIRLNMQTNSEDVFKAQFHVANNRRNPQVTFSSDLMATLTSSSVGLHALINDARGKKGVDLGAELQFLEDNFRLHISPHTPILAYRRFQLNEDNYIVLHNNRRLEANVDLLADDGTGFILYTTPNEAALQDITLSVHKFNLGELSAVIPYMPNIEGLLGGDVHFIQDEKNMSFSVEAQVQKMVYEGAPLGTLGVNAIYLPNADGTHFVDGIMLHDGNEIATLSGSYNPKGEGRLDAQAALQKLPLALANGFVPNGEIALKGYADAQLEVHGAINKLVMNGQLSTQEMKVLSEMYSLDLRLPDDTLTIQNSQILLNRIEAYSKGKHPITLDGTIDMRQINDISLNLNVEARNFELINAPKTPRAVAYGKVYVDFNSRLTGNLSNLRLRGRLKVLGRTDVNYVLTDSPLTVEDQLADLVTFVDFEREELQEEETTVQPQNIDMRMNVSIEPAAQVHCLLSTDGTNYINLEGGGDLLLSYDTRNNMRLQGRYTIISGKMNYTLMVMSLRDCEIKSGSYVEFTGDIMNPKLHLSATERVKTTVYEDKTPRSVSFDVGIDLSQTLNDIGMAFTIDAPEDVTISNQLASMTQEGRGKVAVTMLATGMYLTDEGTAQGFSGTNALNSFLQTQIAAISNKAFNTIDLNFGIDNTNTASGATQTDYNFSFAKRFWGNRIRLIIGGKVSSGPEAQNTGQSIVDNVSIEYRLDNSATRYVRIYYDRSAESLMEDEITEMGAGIVLRRKSTRLGELFIFRNRKREKQ